MTWTEDIIPIDTARTLDGLLRERVKRTPHNIAYRYFDQTHKHWLDNSWLEISNMIAQWRAALAREQLSPGDRVAIMMRNCREWVLFEQAALSLGLVVVPLYPNDRAVNAAYILDHAGVSLLLLENDRQRNRLVRYLDDNKQLLRILILNRSIDHSNNEIVNSVSDWLNDEQIETTYETKPDDLATIVYTSGTTGQPKGVMLSHYNILWNANSGVASITIYQEDIFLSFLPLSHMLERTVGYYVPMISGATVAYTRSIAEMAEDILVIKPSVIISVPRIWERIHSRIHATLDERPLIARLLMKLTVHIGWQRFQYQQGRASWGPGLLVWPLLDKLVAVKVRNRLGGRLRFSITGGASLSPHVARFFISLGIMLEQGYGLTETSPVTTVNKLEDNIPDSVGLLLRDVEFKTGDNNELFFRGPGVMLGYWHNDIASRNMIDPDGWLHTGDVGNIIDGHIYVTGRLKEILVLANGEKVPPADIEAALVGDALIEQAIVVGEARPYLSAILILNKDNWASFASDQHLDSEADESLQSA